ncbi:MAG TPA: pyruvate ferredoxin oxidoreductase, partial [Euryarchaeota archaeon]|nr:pyruvate ferredoxin oxidoreductase [Euryarchaeota archaeon]
MIEIRFHGRGGQGAVTAADLLAMASFFDGKYSQAFPSFGTERRGAPVTAFARISDSFIRIRSQIYFP